MDQTTKTTKAADELTAFTAEVSKKISELTTGLVRKAFELQAFAGQARGVPVTSEELAAILEEAAAADDDMRENFVRWPRQADGADTGVYFSDEDCRAHWSTACQRKERAVSALVKFAKARRPAAG